MSEETQIENGTRRRISVVAIALLIVAIVALAGCIMAGTETAQIGVMMCLSGDLGPVGPGLVEGVELAAWDANREERINVSLIIEDTATSADKAVEVGTKLIDIDGVQVIVGPMMSPSVLSLAEKANDNKVVLISPSGTAASISDAGDYIFRVCPSDDLQGRALADLADAKEYTKVATLVVNNDYGVGLEDTFEAEFSGEVTSTVRFESGKADYRTELETIKGDSPEAVMIVAYPESATVILKQAMELNLGTDWIAAEGIADPVMLERPEIIPELEKMLFTKPVSPKDLASYQDFLELFHEKYGDDKDPGIYAEYAYDATNLAIEAIIDAGNDGEKIKDALYEIGDGYEGASGIKTFDENGDVTSDFDILGVRNNEMVSVGSWIDGEVTLE
jgi:ABC-type branched-subunit amino acid transport system substrate-binding protein